jgi:signal transduction histidine kinase/CheY-like chemotaxis protein
MRMRWIQYRRPRFLLIAVAAGAAMLGVAMAAVVHFRQLRINTTRVWTIGTDNARPYHYLETGPDNQAVPRGMSAEVVQEAARRAGIHLAWRLMPRTAPKTALAEGKVDLWPLVTIRRPPIANVHVTAPYLRNSFVSLSTDPRFSERSSRALVRRVALMGIMAAFYPNSMFPGAEIFAKSTREDAFSAVCAGEADAVLVEARVAQQVMLERPPGCESKAFYTMGVQSPPTELGIGSTTEAAAVADRLREEIDAMLEDGIMSRLMESWSFYYSGESELIYQGHRLRASSRLSNGLSAFLVGLSILLLVSFIRMRRARQEALSASFAKSQFLANMSHEIRTPMNGIIGFANLLSETPLNRDQREYAEIIRHSGDALLTIINDILDFSKIESGNLTVERAPCNVHLVAAQVCDLIGPKLAGTFVELVLDWNADVPAFLFGDSVRIRQVLLNLVGNAAKFTSTGHIIIRAHQPTPSHLRIEVRDTGIGIPLEKQSLLFGEFMQADASTTRKYGGTGLGLAISQRLVEAMGGTIGFTSQPGAGSTFWFTLPVGSEPLAGMDPEPDVDLGNMRVLVVDDLPINRELLEAQLGRWNLNHQSASSGVEALTRLRHAARLGEPFDAVLIDYYMPEMNGEQLALAILAEEELRSTPMVMLTAKASDRDEVNRLLRIGFFDVISKPVIRPGQQLLDSLRRAVKGRVSEAATVSLAPLVEGGSGFRDHPVRWRVLLAEDNLINQRLETRLLQREGCQVDIAVNGGEAVKKAIAFNYDVIFMDCQMPEMDGLESAAAIRSLRLETPIVALTANAMPGDRARCMAAGMNDYISKPVKVTELRRVLDRWASVGPIRTGNPLPA